MGCSHSCLASWPNMPNMLSHSSKSYTRMQLSKLSVLSHPNNWETLYLYSTVAVEAVSATLIRETLKGHKPINFTSKTLQGPELKNKQIEKSFPSPRQCNEEAKALLPCPHHYNTHRPARETIIGMTRHGRPNAQIVPRAILEEVQASSWKMGKGSW